MKKNDCLANAYLQRKRLLLQSLFPFLLLFSMLLPAAVSSQDATKIISGTVADESGNPLAGASITVKNSTAGTTSDEKGYFSLRVPAGAKDIVVSIVGYLQQERKISNQKDFRFILKPDQGNLGEVVVVGYGTQKKVNLTGAVDQVSGKVLENRPTPNAIRGLQGVIPGVYINMPSGKPTDTYSMVVRGEGSIGAGGRALVMIDGVEGDPSRLNPADIQTISVIKDASAAAIYGARGAFGVVLITTKSAQKGKTQISFSSNYSLNDRAVKPELLTNGYLWAQNFSDAYYARYRTYPTTVNTGLRFSQDYLSKLKELNDQGALPKVDTDPSTGKYIYYGSTDWQKELYADSDPSTEQALNISGGSDKVNYYLSGRFFSQSGLFRYSPDKYKQYDLRAKGSVQVFPWLKVENNFSLSRRTYFYPESQHNSGVTIFRRIADEYSPIAMLRNPDGTFTKNAAIAFESFLEGGNFEEYLWNQFRNTTSFTAGFFKDRLTVHGDLSYVYTPAVENAQRTPVVYSDAPGSFVVNESSNNWASEETNRTDYLATNVYADYSFKLNKHSFKATIGFNYENTLRKDRTYKRYELINPDLPDPSLITGDNITLTGGGYEWTTAGEFFRVNYNYADRYLLELNGRYDGSSKFPTGQQFGFFPSVSGAWRVSQEPFWKVSEKIISNLKIRASLGSLGNGNVNPYSFLGTMPVSKLGRMINGGNPQKTSSPNVIPNGLTWEKVTTANIGADVGFLDNRLNITFDKYTRYTIGMFTPSLPLPGVFGAGVPKGNYADMKTSGWELSVGWNDQTGSAHPLRYGVKFTLSDNHTTVTKYNNPNGLINTYYEGQRLGDLWGYATDGLFKNDDDVAKAADQSLVPSNLSYKTELKPGDLKFVDADGNGKITPGASTLSDHGDMEIIGNTQPRYLFGFTGNVEWHNFSLSLFLQGVGKRDWWPGQDASYFWGQYNRPYGFEPMDTYEKQWSPDNPDAYFPRLVGYVALSNGTSALGIPTDRYLQNAAYVRLKSLSIGYDLPVSLISKIGMNNARVYVTGQNLWVWSPMFRITRTIDPEAIESQSQVDSQVYLIGAYESSQTDLYPILKTFTFGINFTF
jgi:TonB-linked SusC/RagA family outer membrane protein